MNDYVSIPSTVGNFAANQNFSVMAWVRIPSTIQPNATFTDNDILEKWDGSGGYPFVIRYLNQTASVSLRGKITVARYDGTNAPSITSTIRLNDELWHHIGFVKSGTNLSLYIDGIFNGSTTDNTTSTTTNSSPLFIGRRGGGNPNYFKGDIDEVRIYSANLTPYELFCKTPSPANLVAAYNFNNGVPNGNNALLTQIPDYLNTNAGTLNNFANTGNTSNFVSGQVKYVKANAAGNGNDGTSWVNAYTSLQSALTPYFCNDLVEIWVAGGTYKPHASDVNVSFSVPTGMSLYGGFAGTENTINDRNKALIQTTNQTTLSGDLAGNDILSDFSQNRSDNSRNVVDIANK